MYEVSREVLREIRNKRFDFMVFPGKRHGYGDMNNYFVKLLWDYFTEHLMGASHDAVDMYDFNKKIKKQ